MRASLVGVLVLLAGCASPGPFGDADEHRQATAPNIPGLGVQAHITDNGDSIRFHATATNADAELRVAGACAGSSRQATAWRGVVYAVGSAKPLATTDWPCSTYALVPFPPGQGRSFDWSWDGTTDDGARVPAGQYLMTLTFEAYVPGDGDGAPTGRVLVECLVTLR